MHKASTVCIMVSRFLLPETVTREQVFRYLASCDQALFWLDSGDQAERGNSYLGLADSSISCSPGEELVFLDSLREPLHGFQQRKQAFQEPAFTLGWVGWFSYEFGVRLLEMAPAADETVSAVMLRVSAMVECDHVNQRCSVVAEDDAVLSSWLDTHLTKLLASQGESEPQMPAPSPALWRDTEEVYRGRIVDCQEAIHRGDAYLLCLTTQVDVATGEDPVETYLRLRREHATHHGGFLRSGDIALLSVSPERFLAVDASGHALTQPIKGTRPRGASSDADRAIIQELAANEKERAENLMIVDLMRNDFTRVCSPESVRVLALHQIEQYPRVHQMVSTVTGTLRHPYDALDLFTACFPAGSMTGTPKQSAVEILQALEDAPRGVYSGCFGYFSRDGSADLAMVIRSIVVRDGRASIGTGGGITAESDVDAEVEEMRLKAGALLDVLNASERPVM